LNARLPETEALFFFTEAFLPETETLFFGAEVFLPDTESFCQVTNSLF
jgi:hypothetical protein